MAEASQSKSVPEPKGIDEARTQSVKTPNAKPSPSKERQTFKGLLRILQEPGEEALPSTIDQPNEPSIPQDIVLTWAQVKTDFESRVKEGEIPPAEEALYLSALAKHYEYLYEKYPEDWTTQLRAMYYAVAFVWGLSRGIMVGCIYTVSLELREPELFHIIFGFNLMLQGVFSSITGPVFSYLLSNVGQIGGMCFGAAAGVLGSLVIMPVVVHRIKSTSRSSK